MDIIARKSNEEIAKTVKNVLAENVENIEILEVRVGEEVVDSDNGKFLRVIVVFEGTPKKDDFRTFSGATRLTRPVLDESGVTAFPIFSFVSKDDIGATLETP